MNNPNLILLKNMPKDANGLPKYIFVTDKQKRKLIDLRNDPDYRNDFVSVGPFVFAPADVLYIEKRNDYGGALPRYYIERHKEDMEIGSNSQNKALSGRSSIEDGKLYVLDDKTA